MKKLRFITLLLSIIMILSCISACQNGGEAQESDDTSNTESTDTMLETSDTTGAGSETTGDTEADTEDTDSTGSGPDEIYPIFSNKKTKFSIVVPDYAYEEISVTFLPISRLEIPLQL